MLEFLTQLHSEILDLRAFRHVEANEVNRIVGQKVPYLLHQILVCGDGQLTVIFLVVRHELLEALIARKIHRAVLGDFAISEFDHDLATLVLVFPMISTKLPNLLLCLLQISQHELLQLKIFNGEMKSRQIYSLIDHLEEVRHVEALLGDRACDLGLSLQKILIDL